MGNSENTPCSKHTEQMSSRYLLYIIGYTDNINTLCTHKLQRDIFYGDTHKKNQCMKKITLVWVIYSMR